MSKYDARVKMTVWVEVYNVEAADADEAEEIAEELAERYIDVATSQEIPDLNVEVVGYNTVGESEVTTSNDG